MINKEQYENLISGQSIKYGFYNVRFIGKDVDAKHVILEDKFGNRKRIYKHLFLIYTEII